MYESISGKLIERKPTHVVIDVNGVGYFINISLSTYSELRDETGPVTMFVHLIVREDDLRLFGFATKEEREVFRLLIGVSGVGPKVAMTVLSGVGAEKLKEAISTSNIVALTSISGIGKKTAERLIMELKEKVGDLAHKAGVPLKSGGDALLCSERADDVLSALQALGYKRAEANKAISQALTSKPSSSVEELIREALNYIK
jgi:holliday junction DNA helicase RuvA